MYVHSLEQGHLPFLTRKSHGHSYHTHAICSVQQIHHGLSRGLRTVGEEAPVPVYLETGSKVLLCLILRLGH